MSLKCSLFEDLAFQQTMQVLAVYKSIPCNRLRMARFNNKLKEEANLYFDQKKELIKKYFVIDEKGTIKTRSHYEDYLDENRKVKTREIKVEVFKGESEEEQTENREKFADELKELGKAEIELPELRLSWIINSPLSDGQLGLLSPIIIEDKKPEDLEESEESEDKDEG